MALFGLFKKKDDVQKEIEEMQEERQKANRKVCVTCGKSFSLEMEKCPDCDVQLYVENENFCTNENCERHAERYSFVHDDFTCDKCNKPTVIGNICGFNDHV